MVLEIAVDPVAQGMDLNGEVQRAMAQAMPLQDYLETEENKEVKVTIDGHEFRVNPQQMSWSKEFKINEDEIVYDKDITQWMGVKNKRLSINLKTFTALEKEFLWELGDDDGAYPGPHLIEAAIPTGSICMYLKKWSCQQVEGESDNLFYWSLEFVESHEAGI